jgi:hypothetical protein
LTFYIYKDGDRKIVNLDLWRTVFQKEGWSKTEPVEDVEPVLDFSPYDNAQLLHIASVTNVVVESDSDRATLEEQIRLMWSAGGKPSGWLESALAASAPVPPEEMEIPKTHSENPVVETPEEFAGRIAEDPVDVEPIVVEDPVPAEPTGAVDPIETTDEETT